MSRYEQIATISVVRDTHTDKYDAQVVVGSAGYGLYEYETVDALLESAKQLVHRWLASRETQPPPASTDPRSFVP